MIRHRARCHRVVWQVRASRAVASLIDAYNSEATHLIFERQDIVSTNIPDGMKLTTVNDNYHLAVEVDAGWYNSDPAVNHARRVSELEAAKRDITRHVDGIEGIAVLWDTKQICPHCEMDVNDGYVDGEPQCCGPAQAEYIALGNKLSEA